MVYKILAVATTATLFLTQSVAFAQRVSPSPDRLGNYYSYTPNWEVKSSALNCRSGPGTEFAIRTTFNRGTRFTLDTESKNPVVQLDKQQKPWLQVNYAGTTQAPCYVRSNSEFVVPMVEGCGRWDPKTQTCYCGVNEWDTQEQLCVAE